MTTASSRLAVLGSFRPEHGGTIDELEIAFRTWGTPVPAERPRNAVLVLHALTGDADAATWWDNVVGPGKALDTDHWYVVSANVLGGCAGSTGPASVAGDGKPWGSRFPAITIRDQVRAERRLADHLGIERFAAVLGGSMGGMRALEWGLMYPDRVGALLVLATSAAASADQLGTQSTQVAAITGDPHWDSGDYDRAGPTPEHGLGIARRIAHLTYRSATELDLRFGRDRRADEEFQVVSYLEHQADKLVARFDAGSYVALTRAMDSHDIGRGRGGAVPALARVRIPTVVAGVDSDRLYPLHQQRELASAIPTAGPLRVITSPYGHDGFLVEAGQVGEVVRETLELAARVAEAHPRTHPVAL